MLRSAVAGPIAQYVLTDRSLCPRTPFSATVRQRKPFASLRQSCSRQLAQRGRHLPPTCSAVLDWPQEAELQSTGLGWPRGFHSRYILKEQLGKGSFGTVYLATEQVTGQQVAAKVIPKERKGTTTEHIIDKIQQEV